MKNRKQKKAIYIYKKPKERRKKNYLKKENTVVGQEPVVIAPVVGLSGEGARDEGLHQQVDVQVGNLGQDVVVAVDILLGNKNALCKNENVNKLMCML